jgi:chromosome segregation ATPase
MQSVPDSGFDRDPQPDAGSVLAGRVDALAARVGEVEAEIQAAVVAGDGKSLKELAKALDAWSKHDPKLEERVTRNVEALGDRFVMLAERVDSVAQTVATTAAGLSGREGELAALRRTMKEENAAVATTVAELRSRVDPKPLLDLSEKVKAISDQTLALKRGLQRLSDATTSRVDLLGQRVEALGSSVAGGISALDTREREVADLRTALDELTVHTDSTAARVAARGDELAKLGEAVGAQESGLSELRALASKTSTQVEAAVTEFRRTINTLISKVARLDEVAARDEVASPDAVRGLGDQVAKLEAELNSLATDLRATVERDGNNESEIAALRQRVAEGDIHVPAVAELREAVVGLSSRLSELDDVANAETVRGLAHQVDAARAEVEGLAEQVRVLTTTVSETAAQDDSRAAHIEALSRRFDEGRARVETLVGDLQEAIETMPASSSPDPALVESVDAVTDRVAELVTELERVRTQAREHVEEIGSRHANLERLMGEGTSRLKALERNQAAGAEEAARGAEDTAAHLGRFEDQLEALAAKLEEIDGDRGAVREEMAGVSLRVDSAISSLGHELSALRDAVAQATDAPEGRFAEIGMRLDALERADTEGAVTAVEAELAELAAQVDAVRRGREAAAGEIAQRAELAGERAALRSQLEALAATLSEQVSRRSDRSDALHSELVERLDAVERATVATTSEMERLAELRASAFASIAARLDDTPVVAANSEARDLVAELAGRVDGVMSRLASVEERESASRDTGNGSYRVEIRSLAIRMDHAEAAAREHREAVLAELERLSSQIESRLQRLEDEVGATDGPSNLASPIGDVVPFRTEA